MLNQSSVEALYSGAFVENYFDCVENLPDDVQRYMTRMRELDVTYRAYLRDVETHLDMCIASPKDEQGQGKAYSKAYLRVQKSLIAAQELGDEKLQIMQVLQDVIDNKSRQLNLDHRKLVSCLEFNTNGNIKEEPVPPSPPDIKEPIPPPLVTNNNTLVPHQHTAIHNNAAATPPHIQEKEKEKSDRENKNSGERASKRPRRTRNDTQSGADSGGADPGPSHTTTTNTNTTTQKKGMGKKKKRKSRQSAAQSQREETPPPEEPDPIDPDEPTYCLCDQISFGEMILCDNDLCPIEWFHFSCVSLTTKPKGKWFCPKCRGDRPNVMKPKVQFLKELEQYNKLKEDKA